MKETQIAIFYNEIDRLQRANHTLTASNQILLDVISTMRADHAVAVARIKAEMVPGFSWPDPDRVRHLSSKLDAVQVDMVKMAQKIAKLTRKHDIAIAERDKAVLPQTRLLPQMAILSGGLYKNCLKYLFRD